VVPNRTIVNEVGGTLPGLALRRVLGRPHCVSGATIGSRCSAARASHTGGYGKRRTGTRSASYAQATETHSGSRASFDIGRHPTKMAASPAAAALFVRRRSWRKPVVASLTRDGDRPPPRGPPLGAGPPGRLACHARRRRVALGIGRASRKTGPRYARRRWTPAPPTRELVWGPGHENRGVVTVNCAEEQAVIGQRGDGSTWMGWSWSRATRCGRLVNLALTAVEGRAGRAAFSRRRFDRERRHAVEGPAGPAADGTGATPVAGRGSPPASRYRRRPTRVGRGRRTARRRQGRGRDPREGRHDPEVGPRHDLNDTDQCNVEPHRPRSQRCQSGRFA
jgi:hypothetical protein